MSAFKMAALCLAACSVSGCGVVREARIAVPSDVAASTERLELRGMGGGTRGGFELAGERGSFARSAERLSMPIVRNRTGGGSFEYGALAGRCGFREGELHAGSVSVTTRPFAYRCSFHRDGRPIDAELILEESYNSPTAMLSKRERRGTLFFEGQRIELRSLHRDQGGGLPTAAPLGYAFDVDGRQIGAIDLNGTSKTLYLPRGGAREAVLAASLALSVLWDPAEV